MRRETYKMAVIGAATAGLGAVLALLQHGVDALVVLDAMFRTAASLQNQKWLQSGVFYLNNPILALKLWQGFQTMAQAAQPFLLQRGAHFVAVAENTLRAYEAVAAQCGIPCRASRPSTCRARRGWGQRSASGAFGPPTR